MTSPSPRGLPPRTHARRGWTISDDTPERPLSEQPRGGRGLPSPDRRRLVDQNIIHDFDEALAIRNLRGCYGVVQRRRYQDFLRLVIGPRVLDVGCGLGLLSRICLDAGHGVVSIDLDDHSLTLAKRLYSVPARKASVYDTGLPRNSIDTALLFDVIEHLDLSPLLSELGHLGTRRVIIFDSNVRNPLLRWYRRRVGHAEHREYTPDDIVAEFCAGGFRLTSLSYHDVLALPLTGGLQRDAVPVVGRLPAVVVASDRLAERAAHRLHIDRILAFRYLLVFDR